MTHEVDIAFSLCRGRVSSAKQQLLRKFSSEETPIFLYGVDYAAPTNSIKSPKPKSSKQSQNHLSVQSNTTPSANNNSVISKTSIHLSPVSDSRHAIKPNTQQSRTYQSDTCINLNKSPQTQRKINQLSNATHSNEYLEEIFETSPSNYLQPTQRPQFLKLSTHFENRDSKEKNEDNNIQDYQSDNSNTATKLLPQKYPKVHSAKPKHQNLVLSPQSEPESIPKSTKKVLILSAPKHLNAQQSENSSLKLNSSIKTKSKNLPITKSTQKPSIAPKSSEKSIIPEKSENPLIAPQSQKHLISKKIQESSNASLQQKSEIKAPQQKSLIESLPQSSLIEAPLQNQPIVLQRSPAVSQLQNPSIESDSTTNTKTQLTEKSTKKLLNNPKSDMDFSSKKQKSNKNNQSRKMEFAEDPSLISVAQRAKSLMVKNKSDTPKAFVPTELVKLETEENQEPVLSLKDRIKVYNSSTVNTDFNRSQQKIRHKTQPISLDDIVRANAMILDNTDATSTIASPSISNSQETLMDLGDEPMSPPASSNKNFPVNSSAKKSSRVLRAQSCLMNQNSIINKSFDEQEEFQTLTSGAVKQFVENCNLTRRDSDNISISEEAESQGSYNCRQGGTRNSAISRKLAFKKATSEDKKDTPERKVYTKKPHLTQPITHFEIDQTDMNNSENLSISERIASIRHDEQRWRNKVDKNGDNKAQPRPGSILDIQSQLNQNQEEWKKRVEVKDVDQYTTDAKLRKSNRQKTNRFTIHGGDDLAAATMASNLKFIQRFMKDPTSDEPKTAAQFILTSNMKLKENVGFVAPSSTIVTQEPKNSAIELQTRTNTVSVPKISDKSLSNFFNTNPDDQIQNQLNSQANTDDFDDIFQNMQHLQVTKKSVKPIRNQKTRSRNPLKKLNQREDVKDEYEERVSNINDMELKRVNVESIKSKSDFAQEALAGLSQKEDLTKIRLKPTETAKEFEKKFVSPFKDLMLVLVKGRKRVQVRQVKPVKESMNYGDCYLLITKNRLFVWLGECANVIETNKANELACWIAKTKSMQYKGPPQPILVKSDDCESNLSVKQFWQCLGYDKVQDCSPCGDNYEDELFEKWIQWTNQIYRVNGDQLTPVAEFWGKIPKYEMLTDTSVFILDFGTEIYLWSGSKASHTDKMYGRDFLKQLFYRGYDYEGCMINPLDPLPETPNQMESFKSINRPDWVIVGRLPQKGETTLFIEKFLDWPDQRRLIKVNNRMNIDKNLLNTELHSVDFDSLLNEIPKNVHLMIDGKNVGRGGEWKVLEDGIVRRFRVDTKKLEMWHIEPKEAAKIENTNNYGHLASTDAYIIYWEYELATVGRYNRNKVTSNVSKAYFFWQGNNTSINEKTASALMTIDLDTERSSQIRVLENEEPPVFCRLFDGAMVIYQNSIAKSDRNSVLLFILRGDIEGEAHFVEVDCKSESLRSRGVFLLVSPKFGRAFLWIGKQSSKNCQKAANYSIESLKKKQPSEFIQPNQKLSVEVIYESSESRQFWTMMGAVKRRHSIVENKSFGPLRCWNASAVTGQFIMTEIKYSLQPDYDSDESDSMVSSFPLLQSILYSASQPSLFLIWNVDRAYIWQGWYPHLSSTSSSNNSPRRSQHSSVASDSNGSTDETGSDADVVKDDKVNWALAANRIAAEKIAVMRTVKNYLDNHLNKQISVSIIYAGLEPIEFQELFPFWSVDVTARSSNLARGYIHNQQDDLENVLDSYLNSKFTVEELRQNPLPEMVVPWKKEVYLSDFDFQKLFEMTKEEFNKMTPWKQREKKVELKFF